MLKDKTALITGTNRGIGKAILEEFAENGANIFAHARKQTKEFEQMISALSKKYGVNITPVYFDLSNVEETKTAFKEIYITRTKLDILVNNAGVPHGGLFQMTPVSKIREIFEVNLFAEMELTQLVLKLMIRQGGGSIVNIASISGIELIEGNCAYGVSKAAVIAWTKTLAIECARNGIRINAVAPGPTDTDMVKLMDNIAYDRMIKNSAMQRLAKPAEIAKAVLFLASDAASFVNGQVLRVDGGSQ